MPPTQTLEELGPAAGAVSLSAGACIVSGVGGGVVTAYDIGRVLMKGPAIVFRRPYPAPGGHDARSTLEAWRMGLSNSASLVRCSSVNGGASTSTRST